MRAWIPAHPPRHQSIVDRLPELPPLADLAERLTANPSHYRPPHRRRPARPLPLPRMVETEQPVQPVGRQTGPARGRAGSHHRGRRDRRGAGRARTRRVSPRPRQVAENQYTELRRWRARGPLGRVNERREIYRGAGRGHAGRGRPDLAGSLNNQSLRVGRRGGRTRATRCRQHRGRRDPRTGSGPPGRVSPDIARSLSNQSTALAAMGRREDAPGASPRPSGPAHRGAGAARTATRSAPTSTGR